MNVELYDEALRRLAAAYDDPAAQFALMKRDGLNVLERQYLRMFVRDVLLENGWRVQSDNPDILEPPNQEAKAP